MIEWNNKYPLDREYRKKFNIPFNSPEHRKVRQLDIYLNWLEDHLYDTAIEAVKDQISKEQDYKKGIWIREAKLEDEAAIELFDQLDINKIEDEQ